MLLDTNQCFRLCKGFVGWIQTIKSGKDELLDICAFEDTITMWHSKDHNAEDITGIPAVIEDERCSNRQNIQEAQNSIPR